MTDFPDLKLKTLVNFPARASGGTGIEITKTDGAYTVDLDLGDLVPVSSVASLATTYVVLWNETDDSYSRISLTDLATALGIV